MEKWKRNDFVSFKTQIFISSIHDYKFNNQTVTSCDGIARSYYALTVGGNNKPNDSKYTMMSINIQPRSVST